MLRSCLNYMRTQTLPQWQVRQAAQTTQGIQCLVIALHRISRIGTREKHQGGEFRTRAGLSHALGSIQQCLNATPGLRLTLQRRNASL